MRAGKLLILSVGDMVQMISGKLAEDKVEEKLMQNLEVSVDKVTLN